jgi:hypothetical protein
MTARLLLIYNADGGLLNGALDLLHKWISPSTYACGLCALTYDTLGMKRDWKQAIEALPLPAAFLHRDDWLAGRPGDRTPLPAILLERPDGRRDTLVSPADFAGVADVPGLVALLADRLAAAGYPAGRGAVPAGLDPG